MSDYLSDRKSANVDVRYQLMQERQNPNSVKKENLPPPPTPSVNRLRSGTFKRPESSGFKNTVKGKTLFSFYIYINIMI